MQKTGTLTVTNVTEQKDFFEGGINREKRQAFADFYLRVI